MLFKTSWLVLSRDLTTRAATPWTDHAIKCRLAATFGRILAMRQGALWSVVALVLATSFGCSGSHADLAPVSGVVRLDGNPVTSGRVTFWPESGRNASGAIHSDGTFVLGTYDDGDGASVGLHRIAITGVGQGAPQRPNFDTDATAQRPKPGDFPAKYTSPEASGLSYEVKADAENHVELNLKSK